MLDIKENTTSLPMLTMSRLDPSTYDKEVYYVQGRTIQQGCAYISMRIMSSHETFSHGPLFSTTRKVRWRSLWVAFQAILMAWQDASTLKDQFYYARQCLIKMFPGHSRPGITYQGFVKARTRLTAGIQESLQQHLGGHHKQLAGSSWQINGWVPLAADGSLFNTPRTAANEETLACSGREKSSPQITTTLLYHIGTGLPWDWRSGSGKTAERTLLRQMLEHVPPRTLLIADAGFTGFDLFQQMLSGQISFLIRASSRVTLLTELTNWVSEVNFKQKRVWLWPANRHDHPPLELRLIRLKAKNKSKLSRGYQEVFLITNVLDETQLSEEQASLFYQSRWGVEVLFRDFKQTLEYRTLLSRAPQQAYDELYWGIVGLLVMGLMVSSGLQDAHVPILKKSAAESLRIIRRAMPESRRWRCKKDIRVLFSIALLDEYQRNGAKQIRDWPRKKKEQPPGPPTVRAATEKEIACAKRFYENAS